MRKSNTLDGTLDNLEYHENGLNLEIERMKSAKHITPAIFHSLSNALDRRDLALRSMKRLLKTNREKID